MKNGETRFGRFLPGRPGAYELKTADVPGAWEYVYQNGDILVRVDQYGVVNAQARPPYGVMLFKREWQEKYAKWLVWVSAEGHFGGLPVTGFARPRLSPNAGPEKTRVVFAPERATYTAEYGAFRIVTELMLPSSGAEAALSTTVENTGRKADVFTVTPAFCPYVSEAVLAPWDKPEWYLQTEAGLQDGRLAFCIKHTDPAGDAAKRRVAVFAADTAGLEGVEVRLERFADGGTFYAPDAVLKGKLSLAPARLKTAGAFRQESTLAGYPQVCAAQYRVELAPGERRTFTQVLSAQDEAARGVFSQEEARRAFRLLDGSVREKEAERVRASYRELFSKRQITTEDALFDAYVNAFLPLQMDWTASLDRGWPTGMRGVRDAANDFMGMLFFAPERARAIAESLLARQRTDGWFPRQVAAERSGTKHDLRDYRDGGAFVTELAYEYVAETGDAAFLAEPLPWLDSLEEQPVYEHLLAAVNYYLAPENVGEHGLCKIGEGDWLDAVNRAGVLGRGESVTITCQAIIALGYVRDLLAYGVKKRVIAEEALARAAGFEERAERFRQDLRRHAWNEKAGFFSSVFTDAGAWLFSENDPDGACRMYGPANYYAILCGAAGEEETARILENAEKLRCGYGYRLFWPPWGDRPIPSVGRIASGDVAAGLWENGGVYNHGAQGFLIRALAAAGKGSALSGALSAMLPYDEAFHPVEITQGAPYAVVNCYQCVAGFEGRAGMPFLTGTVAMCLRAVYTWMLGIRPVPEGLLLRPCLPTGTHSKRAELLYRGRRISVEFTGCNTGGLPEVLLSGTPVSLSRVDLSDRRPAAFVPAELLTESAAIEVRLR